MINEFKKIAPAIVESVKARVTNEMTDEEVMAVIHEEIVSYFDKQQQMMVEYLTFNQEINKLHVNAEPKNIAITPDEKYVFVTIPSDTSVLIIDISDNNSIVKQIKVGGNPQGIAISQNAEFVLVANTVSSINLNSVSVIDIFNKELIDTIYVSNDDAFPQHIAITQDSKFAYVTNKKNENITVLRLDLIGN